jgi:hypothetical protein
MPIAVITAIAALLSLIEKASGAVIKIRQDLQQSGEWSGAEADAFDARMTKAFGSDAWKTDEQLGGG